MASGVTPPGWYPDPTDSTRDRWWGGSGWTDQTRSSTRGADTGMAGPGAGGTADPPTHATVLRPPADRVGPPVTAAVGPTLGAADVPRGGSGRRGLIAVLVGSTLAASIVAGLLAGALLLGGDDNAGTATSLPEAATGTRDGTSSSAPATQPPTTVPSATVAPATVPPATAAPPGAPPVAVPSPTVGAAQPARSARVVRTCGASGKGDCFLAVRTGPSPGSSEVRAARLDEGDVTTVVCQVAGGSVSSSVLGRPTTVWARDVNGHYLSAAFLDVAGWDPFVLSYPCT
jgi:hypothetical protein